LNNAELIRDLRITGLMVKKEGRKEGGKGICSTYRQSETLAHLEISVKRDSNFTFAVEIIEHAHVCNGELEDRHRR
jgi:hypothetical protein